MNIGDKIKDIRINKNISREQLAASIHKSPSMVKAYENGYSELNINILTDIALALNVSLISLLIDDPNDVLNIVKDYYNLRDNSKYRLEDDFMILMEVLRTKYK